MLCSRLPAPGLHRPHSHWSHRELGPDPQALTQSVWVESESLHFSLVSR